MTKVSPNAAASNAGPCISDEHSGVRQIAPGIQDLPTASDAFGKPRRADPESTSDTAKYVHWGCGLVAPPTWTNFDVSWSLRAQQMPLLGRLFVRGANTFPANVRYGDIAAGLPVSPHSCLAVYSSQVIDYLAYDDCLQALRNSFQYLQPGGIFRFNCMDVKELAAAYLNSGGRQSSEVFMKHMRLGVASRPQGAAASLRELFRNTGRTRWLWDFDTMAAQLKIVGFREVRRARFGDSSEPRFADVEDERAWSQHRLTCECVRP